MITDLACLLFRGADTDSDTSDADSDADIEYCNNAEQPQTSDFWRSPITLAETIIRIIPNPVDPSRICKMQPQTVECNATFVVDMTKLKDSRDLTADAHGAWIPGGKPRVHFCVESNKAGKILRVSCTETTFSQVV